MGASCVRDCERTACVAAEECVATGPAEVPLPAVRDAGRVQSIAVPPVLNWTQALKRSANAPMESPRFEETSARLSTNRTKAGGLGSVVAGIVAGSPLPSPRPPTERASAENEGGANPSETYEGTFLGRMKHGQGRLRSGTSTYEGQFVDDLKHGVGTLSWDDGRVYRGQFGFGKFEGAGKMSWPDGRRYNGQYHEDRKHGEGVFSWMDGRRYDGQWYQGRRQGVGIYTNAKGLTRRGTWQADRPLTWDKADADVQSGSSAAPFQGATSGLASKAPPPAVRVDADDAGKPTAAEVTVQPTGVARERGVALARPALQPAEQKGIEDEVQIEA
eukprot:TRINITY_DN47472_c0_g1_i1.p1 TRINITY_DN47472_c0_g1~~TRINITY_DN47472_c0_g1_i1.p1  ORF type:complete len:338 (+),score=62.97 TRINITY_DN47472_c0_g1_i1:22-1014(+)